jgi:hypothetical protein
MYVRTAPTEYGARQLARTMWAGEMRCYGAIVLFAVGKSQDTNIMQMMQASVCNRVHVLLFKAQRIMRNTNFSCKLKLAFNYTSKNLKFA